MKKLLLFSLVCVMITLSMSFTTNSANSAASVTNSMFTVSPLTDQIVFPWTDANFPFENHTLVIIYYEWRYPNNDYHKEVLMSFSNNHTFTMCNGVYPMLHLITTQSPPLFYKLIYSAYTDGEFLGLGVWTLGDPPVPLCSDEPVE